MPNDIASDSAGVGLGPFAAGTTAAFVRSIVEGACVCVNLA